MMDSQPLILTVNRRLATYLMQVYDQDKLKGGNSGWVAPSILPLDDWLKGLWIHHISDARSLLTPYSEFVLWDQVIQKNTQHFPFIQRDSLVLDIQKAWRFLNQWNLSISEFKQYPLDESHSFFIRAAQGFKEMCADRQVISSSQILSILIKHLDEISKNLSKQIFFVGFDDISPQLSSFINALQSKSKANVQCIDFYEKPYKAQVSRIGFQDQTTEIEKAALWARQQIDMHPYRSVGCVFLNLSDIQEKVRQVFQHRFAGDLKAFNLSLGRSLLDYPVIKAAMSTLSWAVYPTMELESIRAWLYSPYLIASETEMIPRVILSARLLAQGASALSAEELCLLLTRPDDDCYSPKLSAALKALGKTVRHLNALEQTPRQWADIFITQLNIFGWPGQRSLDDKEPQTIQRFWEIIEVFKQLDYFLQKITLSTSFHLLTQLMEMTMFQPQVNLKSPIQIMGVLESSGILFDRLWVGSMREDLWPLVPTPNRFIPIALQKQKEMPYASKNRELLMSQRITNRLFQSAHNVILSYSSPGMGMPSSFSPLIRSIKEMIDTEMFEHSFSKKIDAMEVFETLIEDLAPPIQSDEKVQGGTSILKNQAACPFKAFAQARLGVSRPPRMSQGLTQQDKGTLIHKVLEVFWSVFKKQKNVLALNKNELTLNLSKMTKQALEEIVLDRPWLVNSCVIEVEHNRLVSLLLKWLELEMEREPFDVVNVEKSLKIPFNNMIISVKIDRIDKLEDGSHILLDYKTGKVSPKSWEGERPDEPQLPFYWVMNDMPISAIAFAQIQPEALQFKGVGLRSDILKDVGMWPEKTWQELKMTWKTILEQLLLDFYIGKAGVDPKNGRKTCITCGFESLCRVSEKLS